MYKFVPFPLFYCYPKFRNVDESTVPFHSIRLGWGRGAGWPKFERRPLRGPVPLSLLFHLSLERCVIFKPLRKSMQSARILFAIVYKHGNQTVANGAEYALWRWLFLRPPAQGLALLASL